MKSALLFIALLLASSSIYADQRAIGFFNQGNQFLHGHNGVSADPFRAYGFFNQSAQLGYGPAQLQLGLQLLSGNGVEKDFVRALQFLQLADSQNVIGARHHIGRVHHFGFGVPRNFGAARRFYVQSFNSGFEESADTLASLHLSQINNAALAENLKDLLEQHAKDGDAVAQYNLGYSHYIGLNREKNPRQAAIWFMKAASLGDVDAQYMLGELYLAGDGVEQNYEQCFIWSQVAHKNGHADAQQNLQNCQLKLDQEKLEQLMTEADALARVF